MTTAVISVNSPAVKSYQASLKKMTVRQLEAEADSAILHEATAIAKLAFVIQEMQLRGVKLPHLPKVLLSRLEAIATGALLPEALTLYGSSGTTISALGQLSITQQAKALKDGTIPVKRITGAVEKVALDALSPSDIKTAICPVTKKVRPAKDQKPMSRAPSVTGHALHLRFSYAEYQALLKAAVRKSVSPHALIRNTLRGEGYLA